MTDTERAQRLATAIADQEWYEDRIAELEKALEECLERLEWHDARGYGDNLTNIPRANDARAIRVARKVLGK